MRGQSGYVCRSVIPIASGLPAIQGRPLFSPWGGLCQPLHGDFGSDNHCSRQTHLL
jgi:hypothetical protein